MLNINLKDVARKQNLCVQSYASFRDVIKMMNINQKGVITVLRNEKPMGILTERDVVEILYKGCNLDENVGSFSKKTLVSAREDRTIGYALNLMIENNIRRIIVTDYANNFVGLITQQDLLKYLEEDFYRTTIKVKHIVDKLGNLIDIGPDEPLMNVMKRMVENRISAVAIVKDGVAEGIVSEKDILKLADQDIPFVHKVKNYMSTPIISSHMETPLVDIVSMMNDQNIRRIVILDNEGAAVNIVTIRDVMRNLEVDYSDFLEKKLRNAKEILNLFPEMLIEISDMEHEHLIAWANEKVINRFGIQILGKPITHLIPGEKWVKIYSALRKLNKIENIKVKKDDIVTEISGFYIENGHNLEQGRIQLIMRDITEDIKLSTTDPLTGVYNRRFLNEFLIKEIERAHRMAKHFSLVICDIDNFKKINDRHGHISGDIILQSLAQIISGTIRHVDIFGRYGGDEFMIILPETNNRDASTIIDRLRAKIESIEIILTGGSRVSITASFGVATYQQDGHSSDELLIKADERLYKAKSFGKNTVVFA